MTIVDTMPVAKLIRFDHLCAGEPFRIGNSCYVRILRDTCAVSAVNIDNGAAPHIPDEALVEPLPCAAFVVQYEEKP